MAEFESHAPGTFCWAELVTTDAEAAKRFYCVLFGWASQDEKVGPDAIYTTLLHRGQSVAALYQQNAQQEAQGVPPRWGSYVTVADADAAAARVSDLGGEVLVEPFDVFDIGRMTVFRDPTGAILSLWEAKKSAGARLRDETWALCWNELLTTDLEAARIFYSSLFGWDTKADTSGVRPYTTFLADGKATAGLLDLESGGAGEETQWLPYFEVENCHTTADLAQRIGGKVAVPPTDITGVGRFALLQDPQGVFFGIVNEAV